MSKRFGVSKIIFVCFSSLGLAACGGGGGGSGGGPATSTYTSTACSGSEDTCQAGISIHNVASLNSAGYTGDGVKVAVVDTGIDATHPEFDGKTISGYDFASSSTGYAKDENGHGTHIASIIAGDNDGSGIQGIAYDANLHSYKVDNDGDLTMEGLSSDAGIANIFTRHVTDNIDVSNNSWGMGTATIDGVGSGTIRSDWGSTISDVILWLVAPYWFFRLETVDYYTAINEPKYFSAMPYQ